VPCARLHARQITWEWGLAPLAETVELVVSEIVTNAIQASASAVGDRRGSGACGLSVVRLRLATDRRRVLVQVWDGCPSKPQRQRPGSDLESGRGLLLIEALSTEWGTYAPPGSRGKTVWCVIADPG
jgi:anti-sigma regulatory factor (Ser/Thr protein kinase)